MQQPKTSDSGGEPDNYLRKEEQGRAATAARSIGYAVCDSRGASGTARDGVSHDPPSDSSGAGQPPGKARRTSKAVTSRGTEKVDGVDVTGEAGGTLTTDRSGEDTITVVGSQGGASRPSHANLPCQRCGSTDTKFCYYNNQNVKQPRHFCRTCQRHWTAGGTLRNVPVGAGRRKPKAARAGRDPKLADSASTRHVKESNFPMPMPSSAGFGLPDASAAAGLAAMGATAPGSLLAPHPSVGSSLPSTGGDLGGTALQLGLTGGLDALAAWPAGWGAGGLATGLAGGLPLAGLAGGATPGVPTLDEQLLLLQVQQQMQMQALQSQQQQVQTSLNLQLLQAQLLSQAQPQAQQWAGLGLTPLLASGTGGLVAQQLMTAAGGAGGLAAAGSIAASDGSDATALGKHGRS